MSKHDLLFHYFMAYMRRGSCHFLLPSLAATISVSLFWGASCQDCSPSVFSRRILCPDYISISTNKWARAELLLHSRSFPPHDYKHLISTSLTLLYSTCPCNPNLVPCTLTTFRLPIQDLISPCMGHFHKDLNLNLAIQVL